jgi:hypothetical protein
MAQELGMPVKGFVPLSLTASARACPGKMLLYLDIHLHRIEVIYLEQGERLSMRDFAITAEKGLLSLYQRLVDMMAQEFVRTTRFDPFHRAATEQELYDRLPGIFAHFQHNSAMIFEITSGSTPYSITLEREAITRSAEPVYSEVLRLVKRMQQKRGKGQTSLALQLSNRLARLPGCKEMLATLKEVQIIELKRGAAAKGVCRIWHRLASEGNAPGISFFTSRPWQDLQQSVGHRAPDETTAPAAPTHLLYRSIAYPITEKPLMIGCAKDSEDNAIIISAEATGVFTKQCTIALHGRDIILTNAGTQKIYVDEKQVNGSIKLQLGQSIRIGTPGEHLQLIACLDTKIPN